jgi:hypothetical protein
MNKDDVLVDRVPNDGDGRLDVGAVGRVRDATPLLTGIVLIGRGGRMKYAELAPTGPPNDCLLVSATTLRNAGLLIASTKRNKLTGFLT